ncbi:MAG: KH domain-containing protein [Clostridia bacterium]|nr:KH domain-containing protein [Clostridia bacterium]
MKEILELLIKNLVNDQDSVVITETVSDNNEIKYLVKVSEGDMGRVIGKRGKIAQSIRTLIKGIATKENKKVVVEFGD